jgi:AhpD family alkylhydroperoxidase
VDEFKRRIYRSPTQLIADFRAITSRRKEIRTLMRGEVINAAFRERLMLVVTEVNGCRYCSYGHARQALAEGISQEEITALGQGMFAGSPSEEVPALLYAQHWAEANGVPDVAVRERLVEQYGEEVAAEIELVLQMIRMGNLLGNTWDYVLYRISLGRWGGERALRRGIGHGPNSSSL